MQLSRSSTAALGSRQRGLQARPCLSAAPRVQRVVARAGKLQIVTPEELEVAIANRDKAILVDFFATWCGPCLLLAQELEKVAEDMGDKVDILKLDVDANPELASQLQIAGLPTMIFIGTDDTKPALRSEGLMTAETIKNILRKDLQVGA
ncbi:MAG: thioredoxin-related protein [Monoraphidium minutum]|nr:MAG: thioredoxin-related protein [Monoraphidium minutum]